MIKKCIGCGVLLQSSDKDKLGYTKDLKMDYCMRCFRLKNYGEKNDYEQIDEEAIIKKVNKSGGMAFFLIDYLNLNKDTLAFFKKVNLPKVLVISKSDTLRRDMKFNKIKLWLKKVYGISGDIAFISNKNQFKSINIFKMMDQYAVHTCYIMGITNAGKSTFLNSILKQNGIHKEIVTSSKPNTTLDFIKFRMGQYTVYDTPGFNYLNSNAKILDHVIKPVSFNITKPVTVSINNTISFYFQEPNKITIYATDNQFKRTYQNTIENSFILTIYENSNMVIPGIGFINVKNACKVESNMNNIEIRASISGVDYE